MMPFEPMSHLIPPGAQGSVRVEHFEVSEAEASFSRMREAATGGRERSVRPGTYTRLVVDGQLMMTDTQMEQETNAGLLRAARGNVLIAGLGIGMVLVPLLKKAEVNTVLVVEKSQDVIDLVAPHLVKEHEDRLFVFQGDILTWKPDPSWTFDVIYFDIWPSITADNLDDMKALERRYRKVLKPGGWMASWCKIECMRQNRRGFW